MRKKLAGQLFHSHRNIESDWGTDMDQKRSHLSEQSCLETAKNNRLGYCL